MTKKNEKQIYVLSYKKWSVTVATIQQGHRLHDEKGAVFHKCDCIMDSWTCKYATGLLLHA